MLNVLIIRRALWKTGKTPQKLWSIIKELNNKNEQIDNLHSINVNGSVITNKAEMAELFNNYFIDQLCRLFQSLISSKRAKINGVLRNQLATPFSFSPITVYFSIPTNKATAVPTEGKDCPYRGSSYIYIIK